MNYVRMPIPLSSDSNIELAFRYRYSTYLSCPQTHCARGIRIQGTYVGTCYPQRRIRGFRVTGETRHVPAVSWELGPEVPPPKTAKSADLAHYICLFNGKIPSNFRGSKSWR